MRKELEGQARARVQTAYCGDHTVLCRVLGRYMMYVDTRDISLAPHLMLNGYWESWVTLAIQSFVKRGMVCADVGANVGYYTLIMADLVGPQGHVYAFEPNPSTAALLRRSVDVNGYLDRVTVIEAAVGETSGEARLEFPKQHPINGSIISTPTRVYPNETIENANVPTVCLDDAIDGRLDFLKADIEGGELGMLEGMWACLNRNPHLQMCLEWVPGRYAAPDALPRRLVAGGVNVKGQVGGDGSIVPIDVPTASKDGDAIYMLWASRQS